MRYPGSSRQSLAAMAAVMIIAAFLNACTGWYVADLEPQRFSSEKSPKKVRVTLADSTRFEVHHPVVVGDSLVWMVQRSPAETSRQAVALGTIRRVQVHRYDKDLTALLVGGLLLVSLVLIQWDTPCAQSLGGCN